MDYWPFPSVGFEFKALGAGGEKTGIGCKSRMLHIVLIEFSMLKASSIENICLHNEKFI